MEIDKDKVVEIVRDFYNLKINSKFLSVRECDDFWRDIEQALNPTPPRPSKEECIEWFIQAYFKLGACPTPKAVEIVQTTIEYLKEPSLQWVKNTGVKPEYKAITVRLVSGTICSFDSEEEGLRWYFTGSEGDILEYIILE